VKRTNSFCWRTKRFWTELKLVFQVFTPSVF